MSIKPIHPVENAPEAHFDPFPEPKTMPKGWDMTALLALCYAEENAIALDLGINLDLKTGVVEEPLL